MNGVNMQHNHKVLPPSTAPPLAEGAVAGGKQMPQLRYSASWLWWDLYLLLCLVGLPDTTNSNELSHTAIVHNVHVFSAVLLQHLGG